MSPSSSSVALASSMATGESRARQRAARTADACGGPSESPGAATAASRPTGASPARWQAAAHASTEPMTTAAGPSAVRRGDFSSAHIQEAVDDLERELVPLERRHDVRARDAPTHGREHLAGDRHALLARGGSAAGLAHTLPNRLGHLHPRDLVVQELGVAVAGEGQQADEDR